MQRGFGFWTLTFLVIANMIGAGVFTTSGFSLNDLGSPHWVVLAWAVGGVIALSGAFSYSMLIRAMPESGGEYLFLSRAAHPLLGFVAGWVSLIAGFSGSIAFAATAFESYLLPSGPPKGIPTGTLSILSIVVAGFCHGIKPRAGALVQNAVVLIKLVLLAAILAFAGFRLSAGQWQGLEYSGNQLEGWALLSVFAGSLVWISLSYSGFNAAVYIAGEVDDARRIVPRALLSGTAIVFVLYLLLNAVFVYSAPHAQVAGAPDVAAVAAQSLGGLGFERFVRFTIAMCLLTSVFSMMMAAPRVYAKMADDGLMPGPLRIHGGSPRMATVIQVLIAVLLVLTSTLQGLLSYLGLTLSLSAACSACCLFLPSVRTRPIAHPVHIVPAFYIVCTLVAAVLMVVFNPWQLLGTAITFSVGVFAYWIAIFLRTERPRKGDASDDRP